MRSILHRIRAQRRHEARELQAYRASHARIYIARNGRGKIVGYR